MSGNPSPAISVHLRPLPNPLPHSLAHPYIPQPPATPPPPLQMPNRPPPHPVHLAVPHPPFPQAGMSPKHNLGPVGNGFQLPDTRKPRTKPAPVEMKKLVTLPPSNFANLTDKVLTPPVAKLIKRSNSDRWVHSWDIPEVLDEDYKVEEEAEKEHKEVHNIDAVFKPTDLNFIDQMSSASFAKNLELFRSLTAEASTRKTSHNLLLRSNLELNEEEMAEMSKADVWKATERDSPPSVPKKVKRKTPKNLLQNLKRLKTTKKQKKEDIVVSSAEEIPLAKKKTRSVKYDSYKDSPNKLLPPINQRIIQPSRQPLDTKQNEKKSKSEETTTEVISGGAPSSENETSSTSKFSGRSSPLRRRALSAGKKSGLKVKPPEASTPPVPTVVSTIFESTKETPMKPTISFDRAKGEGESATKFIDAKKSIEKVLHTPVVDSNLKQLTTPIVKSSTVQSHPVPPHPQGTHPVPIPVPPFKNATTKQAFYKINTRNEPHSNLNTSNNENFLPNTFELHETHPPAHHVRLAASSHTFLSPNVIATHPLPSKEGLMSSGGLPSIPSAGTLETKEKEQKSAQKKTGKTDAPKRSRSTSLIQKSKLIVRAQISTDSPLPSPKMAQSPKNPRKDTLKQSTDEETIVYEDESDSEIRSAESKVEKVEPLLELKNSSNTLPELPVKATKLSRRDTKKNSFKSMDVEIHHDDRNETQIRFEDEDNEQSQVEKSTAFNPIFLKLLSEGDMIFGDTPSELKGTTEIGLAVLSLDYNWESILLTHKIFMTSEQLFEHLIAIFKNTSSLDKSEEWFVQTRVIRTMCRWFELNISDFSPPSLVNLVNTFLEFLKKGDEIQSSLAKILVDIWRKRVFRWNELKNRSKIWPGAPKPIVLGKIRNYRASTALKSDYQSLSSLDFDVTELSRQMTLLDFEYFSDIPITELILNKSFDSEAKTPKLVKFSKHFNSITWWICTEVTTTPNLKNRVKTLTHAITLAGKLKKLHNWSSFLAVVTGLSQSSFSRMKNTWKALPPTHLTKWEKFEKIASPAENFRYLRELAFASPMVVPSILPMSILLRDLTFIEDGNKSWFEEPTKMINLNKVSLIGRVVSMVSECQKVPYPLTSVSVIQEYLKNFFYIDDSKILHEQSKRIEPTEIL